MMRVNGKKENFVLRKFISFICRDSGWLGICFKK